jgi:hypothetical protein
MAGARDANLLAVIKVHREALIFVRRTEEANAVHGDLTLEALLAIALREEKWVCVSIITHCWMTIAFMGGKHWVPLSMEIAFHTLKQAGKSSSCVQWRLLLVCRSRLLSVGYTVAEALCPCLLMA